MVDYVKQEVSKLECGNSPSSMSLAVAVWDFGRSVFGGEQCASCSIGIPVTPPRPLTSRSGSRAPGLPHRTASSRLAGIENGAAAAAKLAPYCDANGLTRSMDLGEPEKVDGFCRGGRGRADRWRGGDAATEDESTALSEGGGLSRSRGSNGGDG